MPCGVRGCGSLVVFESLFPTSHAGTVPALRVTFLDGLAAQHVGETDDIQNASER